MSEYKIDLAFSKLENALKALGVVVIKPMEEDRSNIDATIQRFEFTIELFWKLLKRILEEKGIDVRYPRDILKEAYAGKLIDQEEMWLKMLRDRNMTSHTYDEKLADEIYKNIQEYYPVFKQALESLKHGR